MWVRRLKVTVLFYPFTLFMTEDPRKEFFSHPCFILALWPYLYLWLLNLPLAAGWYSERDLANLIRLPLLPSPLIIRLALHTTEYKTKRRRLIVQAHYLPAWFLCTQVRYSCTSSGDPKMRGTRWWILSGFTSSTGWVPVVAMPPACSII